MESDEKSKRKEFSMVEFFKVHLKKEPEMNTKKRTDSHNRTPTKNSRDNIGAYESSQKGPQGSKQSLQSIESSSESYLHWEERSNESSGSETNTSRSPCKAYKKRPREESRGRLSEKSPQTIRKKHRHSHSESHERERSRTPKSTGSREKQSTNSSSLDGPRVPRISPIHFDKGSYSSQVTDVNKSRKFCKEDSIKLINQPWKYDKEEHFFFFFGKDSPFSNFHSANFVVKETRYRCSEQFMMHQKAVLFNDLSHARKIMEATDPREMKKLGRKVESFDASVWGKHSQDLVKVGVKAKFEQNERLKQALIHTFPRILVEAAPRDRLWGIGMGSQNYKAYSRTTWRGQNKLGFLLTDIRNEIMEKEGLFR